MRTAALVDSVASRPISRAQGGETGSHRASNPRSGRGSSERGGAAVNDPTATIAELRGLVDGRGSRQSLRVPSRPTAPFEVPDAPQHKGTPLGALLVGRGILSEDQLGEALTAQSSRGERLGDVLVEFGLISERELAGALAEQAGLETIDLSRTELDPELADLLSEELAWELRSIPVRRDGNRVDVATADPLRPDLLARLLDAVRAPVRMLVATPAEIEQAIVNAYAPTAEITDALRQFEADSAARQLPSPRRGPAARLRRRERARRQGRQPDPRSGGARPRVRRAHRAAEGPPAHPRPHRRRAARDPHDAARRWARRSSAASRSWPT